jgi:hypothetical protein
MEMSKGVPRQIYIPAAVIRAANQSERARTFLGVTVAVNMEMSLALTPRISRFDCSVMDGCLIRGLRAATRVCAADAYLPQSHEMDIGHSRDASFRGIRSNIEATWLFDQMQFLCQFSFTGKGVRQSLLIPLNFFTFI